MICIYVIYHKTRYNNELKKLGIFNLKKKYRVIDYFVTMINFLNKQQTLQIFQFLKWDKQ